MRIVRPVAAFRPLFRSRPMPPFLSRLSAEPAPLDWFVRKAWHPWMIVGIVSTGAFIGQFDATVVQLALPSLGHHFGISIHHVSLVALAYLVAFVAFLPVFGRLCEMYGRKMLYIVGYLIFVLASAACGFATDFWELVILRFLQGVGGALLGANSMSILVHTVSLDQRARALGWFAAAQAAGMSLGPVLGGILIQSLGWQWIFWFVVPLGGLAMCAGWLALPRAADATGDHSFDWLGAALMSPALMLIVAVLSHASASHFNLPLNLGMAFVAILLLVLWVRHERKVRAPIIDPALFESAAFCGAALGTMLAYAQLTAMFFLMAFAQSRGFGETPLVSGLHLAVLALAIGLSAPLSSAVRERLGRARISLAAMALTLAGVLLLYVTLGRVENHRVADGMAFVLFGAGLGLFIAPNNDIALAAAPPGLAGAAGALLNLVRVLGASLGVAGGAAFLSLKLHDLNMAGHIRFARGPEMIDAVRDCMPALAAVILCGGLLARLSARRVSAAR